VSPVTETTSNNNSASGAQVITANPVSINGSISSSTDTDYYRLTVGAGKTLTASLGMASNVDFDLYLYNSTGSTQITRSILGTGLTDQLSYTNTGSAAVTVYLRVTRYSRTGNYTLSASQ